jgi:hypothetical protein
LQLLKEGMYTLASNVTITKDPGSFPRHCRSGRTLYVLNILATLNSDSGSSFTDNNGWPKRYADVQDIVSGFLDDYLPPGPFDETAYTLESARRTCPQFNPFYGS